MTVKKPGFSTGARQLFRSQYDGLWFKGKNITFDFFNGAPVHLENKDSNHHVFEGVNITDSGGRYYTYLLGQKPLGGIASLGPWLMECDIGYVQNPGTIALLVRGCDLHDGNSDCVSGARLVIGNRIWNWSSDDVARGSASTFCEIFRTRALCYVRVIRGK